MTDYIYNLVLLMILSIYCMLPVEINAHARIPCVRFKMAEGSPAAKSSVYLYHYDERRQSRLDL